MHTARIAVALASVAFGLSGCGGGDEPTAGGDTAASSQSPSSGAADAPSVAPPAPASKAPNGEAALRTAVEAYSNAYLSGNGVAAHALLSERCKERLGLEAMKGLTLAAKETYGVQPIASYKTDDLAGDLARVTYTYSVPVINQTKEPWVREDGAWHQDDC